MKEKTKYKALAGTALILYGGLTVEDQLLKKCFPENPLNFVNLQTHTVLGATDSTSAISIPFIAPFI